MSPELSTFFHAMLPIVELRTAIPFGIEVLGLPKETAFVWAVVGNMVPVFILLKLLDPVANFARKYVGPLDRFLEKLFTKTREKHNEKFKKYATLFLPIFVAIPLPGSGAWTGILIAFVFGIPYWRSVGLIFLGVTISGIAMTVGTVSLSSLFHVLF